MEQIDQHITCGTTRYYLYQVIRRTVEHGGLYRDIRQGISRGCPLSPLFGALYLKELDQEFDRKGLFYLRYMDDILILSHTRWQNRRAVKALNQCFNRLKVKQHPDKTFIGRIDRGFDFLGYHFSRKALTLASNTVKRHVARIHRLYEQQRNKKASIKTEAFRINRLANYAVFFFLEKPIPAKPSPKSMMLAGSGAEPLYSEVLQLPPEKDVLPTTI